MSAGQTKAAFRVRIVGRMHGSATNNVLHFRALIADQVDPGIINGLLQALAVAVFECVIDTLLPATTQDWTFERVEAVMLQPTQSDPIEETAAAGTTGARANSNVSFCASLINIKSGVGGRRGRGKWFLPPGGDVDMSNSVMSEDLNNLLEQFLLCLFGKFVGQARTTPYQLCVFSRKDFDAQVLKDAFEAMRPVVELSPNQVIAKLGTRKLGVGS